MINLKIKLTKKEFTRDLNKYHTNNENLLQEIRKLRKRIEIINNNHDKYNKDIEEMKIEIKELNKENTKLRKELTIIEEISYKEIEE